MDILEFVCCSVKTLLCYNGDMVCGGRVVVSTGDGAEEKEQKKQLDQFYTRDDVAAECIGHLLSLMEVLPLVDVGNAIFLEPSAGGGAFLRALHSRKLDKCFACDIAPNYKGIVKKDFLEDDISSFLPSKSKVVTIGNPPFGKRARTAAAFVNKAFEYSEIVAFILPLQFQKHSAQNKLINKARLILDETLRPNAFVFNGRDYVVRCCFQVWTTKLVGEDLRLRSTPITKHKDFEMWQYNNTREAEKYFDKEKYEWDFAIPRQGYKDYSLKETDPEKMDRHTQWIFFKAHNKEVLDNLMAIDYNKLSQKNISIPGFGKADVILEYENLFGDSRERLVSLNKNYSW